MTAPKSAKKSATPEKSANPKRKTDWEALHRDYRTGRFTLRELEAKHGADDGLIARKAKREGWTQDLSQAIKQATNAKLIEELVSKEIAEGQQKVSSTVLAAAELNKMVILGHRKDAQSAREAMEAAKAKVMALGASVADIREAATFASAVESLSRTVKNAIEIERKAFGLDDAPPAEDEDDKATKGDINDLAEQFKKVLAK